MIGWLTALAIVLVAGSIVWLARLYTQLGRREDVVEDTRAVLQKVAERQAKRKAKDFQAADRLRDEILEAGYTVEDTPDGPVCRRAE